jgi:V/A-type H+-transporting ATPase subunit G/H
LALEVINSLKDAENQAEEIVNKAQADRKEIIKKAEEKAKEEYTRIIAEANSQVVSIMDTAVKEGEQKAAPIKEKGSQEEEAILNLTGVEFDKAVNMVIERIVNTNGNS